MIKPLPLSGEGVDLLTASWRIRTENQPKTSQNQPPPLPPTPSPSQERGKIKAFSGGLLAHFRGWQDLCEISARVRAHSHHERLTNYAASFRLTHPLFRNDSE